MEHENASSRGDGYPLKVPVRPPQTCWLEREDGYLGEADRLASFNSLASRKDAEERHHWKYGI